MSRRFGLSVSLARPPAAEAKCTCGHARARHCECGCCCLGPKNQADAALPAYKPCDCKGFEATS